MSFSISQDSLRAVALKLLCNCTNGGFSFVYLSMDYSNLASHGLYSAMHLLSYAVGFSIPA